MTALAGAFAATACSAGTFLGLLQKLDGVKKVVLSEARARHLRPGSYVDHEGRIWKVTRIDKPRDWFDETVTMYLRGASNERALDRHQTKIAWLEDEYLPVVTKKTWVPS